MAEAIIFPKLSIDSNEYTFLGWTKEVGDKVKPGSVIAHVETDKAAVEIETNVGGVILQLIDELDGILIPGMVIGYVGIEGEEVEHTPSPLIGFIEKLQKSNRRLSSERADSEAQRKQALAKLKSFSTPQMFVSYSRDDCKIKDEIVNRLRRIYGVKNVWADDLLIGGQKWWDNILHGIQASDLFIYLLSTESITSKYCKAEYQEAQRLQKKFLPVKVRRTVQIPEEINQVQLVDMSQSINIDNFTDLMASINYLVMQKSFTTAPLSPEPTPLP